MLDKAIKSGKEKRKLWRGGRQASRSCRNHGSCPYCRDNRLIQDKKLKIKSDDLLSDLESENLDD